MYSREIDAFFIFSINPNKYVKYFYDQEKITLLSFKKKYIPSLSFDFPSIEIKEKDYHLYSTKIKHINNFIKPKHNLLSIPAYLVTSKNNTNIKKFMNFIHDYFYYLNFLNINNKNNHE